MQTTDKSIDPVTQYLSNPQSIREITRSLTRLYGLGGEDLAQEAAFRALRKKSTFRGNSKVYTWIMRIGINIARSERRKPQPRYLGDHAEDLPDTHFDLDNGLSGIVQKGLSQLSDKHRIALLLVGDGMSYQQIADHLEIRLGTARSRIHYARVQLKGFLEEHLYN